LKKAGRGDRWVKFGVPCVHGLCQKKEKNRQTEEQGHSQKRGSTGRGRTETKKGPTQQCNNRKKYDSIQNPTKKKTEKGRDTVTIETNRMPSKKKLG